MGLPIEIGKEPRRQLRKPVDAQCQILNEIFEAQADARPESLAVIYEDEQITYLELEARANRIARCLRRFQVGRGTVVGVLLPRSIDAYAALLGILKAGAAYVPIDPEYPPERVAYILHNSGARALVTTWALMKLYGGFSGPVLHLDADREVLAGESEARLNRDEGSAGPQDLCYIIYTSGSTGKPKGVMIEHRNAAHLVRAEGRVYRVAPDDRVYQGAPLSFDLSVEEMWLAFHAGATLVPATPEMAHAGPDLSRHLTAMGVTVLSCVPTLLSMLAGDIPTVRILILGGEVCPDWLVARWSRPGRRILNTYGPTETTVIATFAELTPEKPVTIGRPVPGYRLYILDEHLRLLPRGEAGEICIGGAGVARGYVGLPQQTLEKFLPDPFLPSRLGERIYRTGDRGRINTDGHLEFLGRLDGQVKLRGFRIELEEIESAMVQSDGILAAACAVREDQPGVQQLVGYVVPRNGNRPDPQRLRSLLRKRLPAYMIPSHIETVDKLPLRPSGKLDRAALPAPRSTVLTAAESSGLPKTETERLVANIWKELFHLPTVQPSDNFFLDLGGHSLLVARLVTRLRQKPKFASVSVKDVYDHPTLSTFAAALDALAKRYAWRDGKAREVRRAEHTGSERRRQFLGGVLQACSFYFIFAFGAMEWVTPYFVFFLLLAHHHTLLESAAGAASSVLVIFPSLLIAAIGAKWILLGRIQPGRYPLWGAYHLRWWFVQTLIRGLPLDYLSGTPLLPFVYRLLGAQMGRDVHLATDRFATFDLISIGEGSSIDGQASLFGYIVEGGELVIGSITVGRGCFIGTRCVLSENTTMEDGARLEDLSLLQRGGRIPAGQTWGGSPAKRVGHAKPATPRPPEHDPLHRAGITVLYAALVMIFPIVTLATFMPGVALLIRLDIFVHPIQFMVAAPAVGALFVLLLACEIALFKWLLVGRVHPGIYPVDGHFYFRNWIVERFLALSLDVIGPLHATLYLAPWYRLLGAKIGKLVELSTATSTPPDLLEIADGGTVADESSLGVPHIEHGWMTVAPTKIGRRAFVGNSGVLASGTILGDGSLVGVLSRAPSHPTEAARPKASWLGSPPLALPHRQPSEGFREERTYSPPRWLKLARGTFEILRITVPPAGFILVAGIVIDAGLRLLSFAGPGITLLAVPFLYGGCCVGVLLATAFAKWVLIGRFRPFRHPLWSHFIWRLELQNALYEFLATPLILEALKGTPFLPWYLRLLGARIGRQVYIHTTGFLEFDLVDIGDRAALNDDCVMQSHLFEDRVLKASRFRIGSDCMVGGGSVVLYESRMEDGTRLDALSLLMKGETLPPHTSWVGIPARLTDETLNPDDVQRAA